MPVRAAKSQPKPSDNTTGEDDPFEFETYIRTSIHGRLPFLTVEKHRRISVSVAAGKLFGHPKAVELLYDRKRNLIGLRAASVDAPNAFKTMHRSRGREGNFGFSVSAFAFCTHYGVGGGTQRYEVRVQDGMLISDLNKPLVLDKDTEDK